MVRGQGSVVIILLLASVAALLGAYISQYVFGMEPCILCLYQRVPYWAVIALSFLVILFLKKINLKIFLVICIAAFLAGAAIAFFHVGVEYKWWRGTDSCGTKIVAKTAEEMLAAIKAAPVARCDEPPFLFLEISMAGWNFLYSIFLSGLGIFFFRRIKNAKK